MNFTGHLNWNKAIDDGSDYYSIHDTLQYSPTFHTLYYLLSTDPNIVVRRNSTTGDLLGTHQINGADVNDWYFSQCKLSNDELAYF